MSIFEDTNPRELKELLGLIHSGVAALPDFQLDFVWEPGATQELIVSIANNYPAGSLLRVRNTHDLFAYREFQGAPALGGKPTFLVLDGQQRLTSLYQAFFGVGEHRFFLRLQALMDGADFEEAIFHQRATTRRAKRLEKPEVQARELILPLSVLEGGAGGFAQWTLDAADMLATNSGDEVRDTLRRIKDLGKVQQQWIQEIDDYRFPVVTLSDSTGADAVCTIFETLNRTGVKLSVFELLTARFWPKNVNLRQLWTEAQEAHPAIADFETDPYYVLQGISLVCRSAPSCKRSDVLNLASGDIETHWQPAISALAQVLRILRDDCGVIVPRWLPYNTILIPFIAALAARPLPTGPQAADMRAKLVRWFWCAVFGQAYENAPNSQSAKDYGELVTWLDGGDPPESVTRFQFDPRILRDTTPRQRALYRGTVCLVLRGRPRDFHLGQPITGDLMIENHIDDHHVFPDAHLRGARAGLPARLRDCVLNRTLIDRTTNQMISDNPPSRYLTLVRDALQTADLGTLLDSHMIDAGEGAPVWSDDYDRFLDQRQERLWQEIRKVTGVEQASDLMEEEAA